MKQLLLSERETHVLDEMCELYIKIGLGQFGGISKFIETLFADRNIDIKPICEAFQKLEDDLLKNGDWKLEDQHTSSHAIVAFGIQSNLGENYKGWEWACRQLRSKEDQIF